MPRTLRLTVLPTLFLLLPFAGCLSGPLRGADGEAAPRVKLAAGEIEGAKMDGVRVYKGIPFAEPPVGELRWKPPQPLKPWKGVKQSKAFAAAPPQDGVVPMLMGVPKCRSEDCLYLNVWTPAEQSNEKLPVMVWIHGGSFSMGSTSQPLYDGSRLAKKGVVVVSVGYRVGPFGFLAHPELTREGGGTSGNFGLRDLIAGLQWVRDNAAAFGGDAGCVTIFGESAGGSAVSLLATSPKAKGLYHRAISQSGPGFTPSKTAADEPFQLTPTLAVAEAEGEAFLAKLKAKDLAAARALSAEAVLKGGFSGWAAFDGDVLPGDQYEMYRAGRFNDTPVLTGSNADDGGMFVPSRTTPAEFEAAAKRFCDHAGQVLAAYPHANEAEVTRAMRDLAGDGAFHWPARTWAKLQTELGKRKAFVYRFDGPAGGAGHGAELGYVFGNLGQCQKPPAEDAALSDLMSSYWVNFARTGDPNGPCLPEWSAYSAKGTQVMTFAAEIGMKDLPHAQRLEVLDEYFAWRRGPMKHDLRARK